MASQALPLAVLDDYTRTSLPYFSDVQGIAVSYFPETLNPSEPSELDLLVKRLQPFPIISCMRERTTFTAALFSRLPNLKLLITTGTRNRGIDLEAAQSHGVVVAGTASSRKLPEDLEAKLSGIPQPAGDFDATNQQTFALLLSLASRIPTDNHAIRDPDKEGGKAWQSGLGFSLGGKTFGCVGLGRLGAKAARTAKLGFGMNIVAWSDNLDQGKADKAAEKMGLPKEAIRSVGKEELLQTADVVSVHYILSDRSRGLLGKQDLSLMKKSAVLVNTSRGPIVDEQALLDVLNQGAIRGAALDVFDVEPLPRDSLWRTTNWGEDGRSDVVLSPHMGYGVEEVLHRFYAEQADTVQRWLKGEQLPDLLT